MKIKDLNGKKIKYKCDLGDYYYWEAKYVVEVDEDHYALINMQGSCSGYIEFGLESVSEEFVYAFFNNINDIKFEKIDIIFDFKEELEYDPETGEDEVTLIDKKLIFPYLNGDINENRYKFKAKSCCDDSWQYGSLFIEKNHDLTSLKEKEFNYYILPLEADYEDGDIGQYEVDKDTLCQYTGLPDKNGKEIYGGDIIKQSWKANYHQLKYELSEFIYLKGSWWLKTPENGRHLSYKEVMVNLIEASKYNPFTLEIVGNKFDKEINHE